MIYSSNPEPHKKEFENLLKVSKKELDNLSATKPDKILSLGGIKFEPYLADILRKNAVGTVFENTIRETSPQDFPDLILNNYYGIEVKTTNKNHWRTTGNSILESRRNEKAERIFMFFGKLSDPIQFKYRPYEECLAEVVVTHSPRYLIDMNLKSGETIFDKIDIPYNSLRTSENPINPIIKYYRDTLEKGDDLWWINQDEAQHSPVVLKFYSNLEQSKKDELTSKAMIYFPEVFNKKNAKYKRVSSWLATKESVVCGNIRDLFTSNGVEDRKIEKQLIKDIPRIVLNLIDNSKQIIRLIENESSSELSYYWEFETNDENKFKHWKSFVRTHLNTLNKLSEKEIKLILNSLG